ncbi:rho GDP-dissociation inhibitor 1 [Brachionichthys hirsutus]|uniref:rho GDP-dissociation inhibitor 1 n=1 Tax=Brachionichthys hirsutus TaxID=412623 RepID=UPI0036046B0A
MADEEPTLEQLAEMAAANQEQEPKLEYKAPAKKSLQEIQAQDAEDESLNRYKKALLGQSAVRTDANVPNVQLTRLTLECADAPECMSIDLTGKLEDLKPWVVKEKAEYKLKFSFIVNKEIVSGLKYIQETKRKSIQVDKTEYMVGSYSPRPDEYHFSTNLEEAPCGVLSRGNYEVKSKFTDDDKHDYLSFKWNISIKKDWK